MKVKEFLDSCPCLEELDGYLEGLQWQIANAGACLPLTDDLRSILGEVPDRPLQPNYDQITTDILAPIEEYRRLLLSGKTVPRATKMDRAWKYQQGRKPKRIASKNKGR